jgi:hypothetical protein
MASTWSGPKEQFVMPGLVPGIHVLAARAKQTWMAGTKPGHDERTVSSLAQAGDGRGRLGARLVHIG